MLNIEKYKDQILNIHKEKWLSIECAIGNVRGVHLPCNQKCNECELLSLIWLSKEAKEPILDDVERKYLSSLLKPFKSDVVSITKIKTGKCKAFLFIKIRVYNSFSLPLFESGKMYRNMELNKEYTLEELGL